MPIRPPVPNGANGVSWRERFSVPSAPTATSPWTTKNASTPTRTATRIRCKPVVSLAPKMLSAVKATVKPTARGLIGMPAKASMRTR